MEQERENLGNEGEEENTGDASIGWEGLSPTEEELGGDKDALMGLEEEDLEEYGIPSEETKQQQRQSKQVLTQCDQLWARAERLNLPQNHPVIRDIYANLSALQIDRASKKLIKLEEVMAKKIEDKLRGQIRQEVMTEYSLEDKAQGRLPPESGGDMTKAREKLKEVEKRFCQSQVSAEEYAKARREAGLQ